MRYLVTMPSQSSLKANCCGN